MSASPILVVGGGVAGLVTALTLARRGHACELLDAGASIGSGCSRHAAGMLAPISELDVVEPALMRAGLDAASRWRALLGPDAEGDLLAVEGSLLVAHRPEWPLLTQLVNRTVSAGVAELARPVDAGGIEALEPWLSPRLRRGLWVPGEGVVHPARVLPALAARAEAAGVRLRRGAHVEHVAPGRLTVRTSAGSQTRTADLVIDSRGLGARGDRPLRGVRGEYIVVRPNAALPTRPIRLMHPRYPLYIVPRPDGRLYVGATQLESEHDGPVQVRSALELLSALYSLDSRFADAEIEHVGVGIRPAFSDNAPAIDSAAGLISVNGLYRHGFLLAPCLGHAIAALVEDRPVEAVVEPFVRRSGAPLAVSPRA